jgi:hypothetical protein
LIFLLPIVFPAILEKQKKNGTGKIIFCKKTPGASPKNGFSQEISEGV